MMNYSPGPWKWEGYWLLDKDGKRIADDGSACGEYEPEIDTAGDDARLIAAAPEMYEACRAVKDFLLGLEEGTDKDDPLHAIRLLVHARLHEVLDKALAKAEGPAQEAGR